MTANQFLALKVAEWANRDLEQMARRASEPGREAMRLECVELLLAWPLLREIVPAERFDGVCQALREDRGWASSDRLTKRLNDAVQQMVYALDEAAND